MAKFKVYYTIELNEVATEIFNKNDFEVKLCSHNDEETYVKELAEFQPDGIMCRTEPITAKMMDVCKNLKVIGKQGAGLDNIDMDHAAEKNIQVVFAPAGNANAVAEHAI
ncbi:MAG: oxidoreductase, partial [Ruminococcaceae bacterium]|nr:oxidoreductase [Oscillospiraceae bacterium]